MIINLVTPLPDIAEAFEHGVVGNAIKKGIITLNIINIRDHSLRKDKRIDDNAYGGGPGMVLEPEPLFKAISQAKPSHIIGLAPEGTKLTQDKVRSLAKHKSITLVCGRYEGFDARINTHFDEMISIGDYVLSGGDIPALVLIDAIGRLLPGVMQNSDSHEQDSFEQGLLDHEHFTRPKEWQGKSVPDVLTSGDHKAIETYRLMNAIGKTWLNRPDLLIGRKFSQNELALFIKFVQNHNRTR